MTVELDDRLRELFADDRLDLPAPPDAAEVIVAGARRRRRARTAVASAFALTVLVAGGVAVGGLRGLVSEPAAPPQSTVVETVTVTREPVEPAAYSTYRLGMTGQEVRDANHRLVPVRTGADKCVVYVLDSAPGDAVVVSGDDRVVWFRLPWDGTTPSGIRVGVTADEVLARYPKGERDGDRITVAMPGPPAWRYTFPLDGAGKVADVWMESAGHECDLEVR